MTTKNDLEKIKKFYNQVHFLFVESGANSTHFGLWDQDTKNYMQASENLNNFVGDLLELNSNDKVLDAGCGLGGSAISISKKYDLEIVGINIADKQLKSAEKYAKKSKCSKVSFLNRSFLDTKFNDNSFSKIYAIESVCYAENKLDFLNEAYRLLKPNGKLVVCDAYAIKDTYTESEHKLYKTICNGYSVNSFANKNKFEQEIRSAGFKNIEFHDKFNEVKRQFISYHYMGLLICPFVWPLSKLGVLPKNIYNFCMALIANKKLINTRVLTYGAYVAKKQ